MALVFSRDSASFRRRLRGIGFFDRLLKLPGTLECDLIVFITKTDV